MFFSSRASSSGNNGNRLSSDSSSNAGALTMEASTPIKHNEVIVTETDKAVIEEMGACASDLEDIDFEELDDDDDSVNGHRGRRATDSK